jgi:hypothetical protein
MGSILEYKYETDTENFYDCKFWSLVFVKDDLSELFLLCVLMQNYGNDVQQANNLIQTRRLMPNEAG